MPGTMPGDEPPPGDPLRGGDRFILDCVRGGLLDAEIAVRLGVPVGHVRARLEALFAAFGVTARAELAALPEGAAPLAVPAALAPAVPLPLAALVRPPLVQVSPVPLPSPAGTTSAPAAVSGGRWFAGAIAPLAGVVLLFAAVAVAGSLHRRPGPFKMHPQDDIYTLVIAQMMYAGQARSAPASPLPPPRDAWLPAGVPGMEPENLASRPPAFPAGVSLVVLARCQLCDDPPDGIDLVTSDGAGGATVSRLLALAPGPGRHLTSAVAAPGGAVLAAVVCEATTCDAGAGESAILRSVDGGATWPEVGRLPGAATAVGVLGDQVLVTRGGTSPRYLLVPSGAAVEPPPGLARARPLAVGDTLAWPRLTGGALALLPAGDAPQLRWELTNVPYLAAIVAPAPGAPAFALSWYESSPIPEPAFARRMLAVAEGPFITALFVHDGTLSPAAWVDATRLVANADFPLLRNLGPGDFDPRRVPAILDTAARTLVPLPDPAGHDGYFARGATVLAAATAAPAAAPVTWAHALAPWAASEGSSRLLVP